MVDKQHERTLDMMRGGRGAPEKPHHPPPEPIVVPEPEKTDERGYRRQTLYLPPALYEWVRDTSHARRISQQKLFREVFNCYFTEKGVKSWDEFVKEKPPVKKKR